MNLPTHPPTASRSEATFRGMETFDVSGIDLPHGTVIWVPYPKPVYNPDMQQQNRMKIVADERNGNYLLLFLLITTQDGVQHEQEINRIVFENKEALQEFSQAAVAMFSEHAK